MNHPQTLDLAQLQPGFADPVHDAQGCFRAVLNALSQPGRIAVVEDEFPLPAPPAGLGVLQNAILLALADGDTPVWIAPALRDAAAGHYLRFHCGCPLTADLSAAHFVVLGSLDELPALDDLRLGEPEFPDRSATLLIEVEGLAALGPLVLRGPGIEHTQSLGVMGWTPACTAFAQENQSRFPLGVDLILCCDTSLVGLSRSTQLIDKEA